MLDTLNIRQKATYCAHLFKALTKERFAALVPMLESAIKKDAVIIDVGANAGYFSKIFARLAPEGRVYAFEPGSYAGSILKRVIAFRKLDNVIFCPFGLSDTPSQNTLHMPVKKRGSMGFGLSHLGDDKTIDSRDTKTETIRLLTLDIFVADMELERVDFIKCDIEGWELRMLTGASDTLKRFKPVLMLEVNDKFLTRAGDSARALWDFLHANGYKIRAYAEDGTLSDAPEPIADGDIICTPV